MPILEWDTRFELGIKHFDEQHKELVELLNYLHDSINDGAVTGDSAVSDEALESVIVKLIDYACYHFAAEENSMAYHEYHGLPAHREEHVKFCRMVASFHADFKDGKKDFSLDVLSFLGNWLFDHILISDSEYGKFIGKIQNSA